MATPNFLEIEREANIQMKKQLEEIRKIVEKSEIDPLLRIIDIRCLIEKMKGE